MSNKKRIYRSLKEKQGLVRKVDAMVKRKGISVQGACRSYDIWPLQYKHWKNGRGLGEAGKKTGRLAATLPIKQPRRSPRRPAKPITIEIPDTAPMCVLYGPTDQILKALQILRG